MDLRKEGSRNIGTLNSFEVTHKKSVGVLVLLADLLKGALPILILSLNNLPAFLPGVAVGLVVGHCYPVWLNFHGGRGLATGAGITLVINPLLTVVWLLLFLVGLLIKRHVHVGNIVAIAGTMVVVAFLPDTIISKTTLALSRLEDQPTTLSIIAYLILGVMLIKHIEPLIDLMKGQAAQ